MKKKYFIQRLLIISFLIFFLFAISFILPISKREVRVVFIAADNVFAQTKPAASPSATKKSPSHTPTPSAKPSDSTIDKLKQIQQLKEKIATKVGQLRESSQGAVSGFIKEIKDNKLTLVSKKGDQTLSLTPDITYFSLLDGNKKESTLKKLSQNQMITAIGHFDENNKDFVVKIIMVQPIIKNSSGKIADIDSSNFTITVKEKQGNTIVDIEKYTKTFEYSAGQKNWVKGGFSRLKIGDFVHIIGTEDEQDEARIHANKIYTLTFLTLLAPTDIPESTPSATPKNSQK